MKVATRSFLLLMAMLWAVRPASAEILEKRGVFGGLTLTYKVLLPAGYDAAKEYPVVLVFTGGSQQLRGAEGTITSDWKPAAERRGYVVIAPGSPDGSLFFQGADRVFPEFLARILRDYRVKGGKLHVAGHSNGGISAFHVAVRHPQFFSTVTGYPGLVDGADAGRTSALMPMCIFMHVGDRDDGWREAMRRQGTNLKAKGYRVSFTVEKDQVHRLKAAELNLPDRLLDEIESCR